MEQSQNCTDRRAGEAEDWPESSGRSKLFSVESKMQKQTLTASGSTSEMEPWCYRGAKGRVPGRNQLP